MKPFADYRPGTRDIVVLGKIYRKVGITHRLASILAIELDASHRASVREELKALVRHIVSEAEKNGDRPGPKMIDPHDVENIDIDAFMDMEEADNGRH